jgi:hypothetical protein
LSDDKGVRLPFIKAGYFFSAISKPMIAFMTWPIWVFFARTLDRLGKGIRTAARDALLSQEATPETKARVFGFHRAWDTVGACLGPIISLVLLHYFKGSYTSIFYLAFIPGLISVALVFLVKESRRKEIQTERRGFFAYLSYWKASSPGYKKLIIGLLLSPSLIVRTYSFYLGQSKLRGATPCDRSIYFYNWYMQGAFPWVYWLISLVSGRSFQWSHAFCMVYAGFAFSAQWWMIYGLFFLYGLYAGATEGIAKAWITNLASGGNAATAIGFTSCESMCAAASTIAGLIWTNYRQLNL